MGDKSEANNQCARRDGRACILWTFPAWVYEGRRLAIFFYFRVYTIAFATEHVKLVRNPSKFTR